MPIHIKVEEYDEGGRSVAKTERVQYLGKGGLPPSFLEVVQVVEKEYGVTLRHSRRGAPHPSFTGGNNHLDITVEYRGTRKNMRRQAHRMVARATGLWIGDIPRKMREGAPFICFFKSPAPDGWGMVSRGMKGLEGPRGEYFLEADWTLL